jgi:hypothetical protein
MKAAQNLGQELIRYVMPPAGVAIQLRERPLWGPDDPNWVAGGGAMDQVRNDRFSQKISQLRRSDCLVDWSGMGGQMGHRRISLRANELEE